MDRMLAVRFEVPEQKLQSRKDLRIVIVEVDTAVESVIRERAG
jgi:hypothetical protein